MLVTGRSGSGKSMFGLQFIKQGLALDEPGLMLSATHARDLAIYASTIGLDADASARANRLFLLEYEDYVPGRDQEQNIMLPPDGFQQLTTVIAEHSIQRVVLDTVLPWMSMAPPGRLPEHVFSLVRTFERLGVTTVFTLPRPVSGAAQRLRGQIEKVVPVSITIEFDPGNELRSWSVDKFLGIDKLGPARQVAFKPGVGFAEAQTPSDAQEAPAAVSEPEHKSAFAVAQAPPPAAEPELPSELEEPAQPPAGRKISFGQAVLSDE